MALSAPRIALTMIGGGSSFFSWAFPERHRKPVAGKSQQAKYISHVITHHTTLRPAHVHHEIQMDSPAGRFSSMEDLPQR